MTLTISRLLSPFLAPLPLLFFFLLAALLLHWWGWRRRPALLTLLAALAVLLISGYGLGFRQHLRQLECRYPPLDLDRLPVQTRAELRYVVVLGNAHVLDPAWPRSAQLSGASLRRLVEGIDLHRRLPGTKLVLSGGVNIQPEPNAEIVADMAQRLGVPAAELVLEKRPRDTLAEAAMLFPLLGKRPFVLVTSAAHMPRAVRLFKELGMQPLPAPTDFWVSGRTLSDPGNWVPSCGNMALTERVLYEWLAEVWKQFRTFFAKSPS
ncbi:MAG: hypothetical protein BWK76_05275 [Desulfobulbaceae bacterium A2]|nr:MAG: hypothetical protein BWK76_05275 [Desulfobulbaceae bacterium A2]